MYNSDLFVESGSAPAGSICPGSVIPAGSALVPGVYSGPVVTYPSGRITPALAVSGLESRGFRVERKNSRYFVYNPLDRFCGSFSNNNIILFYRASIREVYPWAPVVSIAPVSLLFRTYPSVSTSGVDPVSGLV